MFTLVTQVAGTNNLVEVDQFKTEAEAVFDAHSLADDFEAVEQEVERSEVLAELDLDGRLVFASAVVEADGTRNLVAVFEQ